MTTEKESWKYIVWSIRGQGGKQDSVQKKMRKVKSEIKVYGIVILTETHINRKEEDMRKVGKHLQEYNIYNVHNIDRASTRKGVTICIHKKMIGVKK